MKRRMFTILCLVSLLFVCVHVAKADVTLSTSVDMPAGAINVHITKINVDPAAPAVWVNPTAVSGTTISFGELVELFDPDTGLSLGVFGPEGDAPGRGMYYALDIAVTGGTYPPVLPSVNITWLSPGNPLDPLGKKIIVTPAHVTWEGPLTTDTSELPISGKPAWTADRSPALSFAAADFTGHWTRLYVGVYVPPKIGDPTPGGTPKPFTTTSASAYSGTLKITGAGGVV